MGKKKVSKFNDAPSSGRVNRREAHRDKILGDQISKITDEVHNDESVDLDEVSSRVPLSILRGRDSGSKVCRLGYATRIRVGQAFLGVILSSEASTYLSPQDADIIGKFGIAGINCSWNRLNEIPFDALGKRRNHRLLPLLFAANSVNYGKPFKMNTAEAIAASLYIGSEVVTNNFTHSIFISRNITKAGFKQDAEAILAPFGYGAEFLRLNLLALEAYSSCRNGEEVAILHDKYIRDADARVLEKQRKRDEEVLLTRSDRIGGYMDDMDLPPSEDGEDEEYEDDMAEIEGEVGKCVISEGLLKAEIS